MKISSTEKNEINTSLAFNRQAAVFDTIYCSNTIIQYKRQRVREHVLQYLQPKSSILELNSGTGEDATWFAEQGHFVHATDISHEMLGRLKQKAKDHGLQNNISTEQISFTNLNSLQQKKQYDYIFSNFAGLNCTNVLNSVLESFNDLLKPGGTVTLVLLPKFCLWEFLLLFKGQFKTSFRRFFSRNGAKAHIEGVHFKCWYYNPSYVIKNLERQFDVRSVEGLCTLVPPSYMEGFAEKHPKLYRFLKNKEAVYKKKWPWKYIGDYYIISLQKKIA